MPVGIELSIRDYRDLLKREMPPWMEVFDPDLLNYFSLSGFTYTDKVDSIVVDGTEYQKDEWTLGDFKGDLSIAGTGNYDNCLIDIIEKIDSDDEVWVYTNPNFIQLDSMAVILKQLDDRRNQLFTEMNPKLATTDGLLSFWESIFQSERAIVDGIPETDAAYMARAISELFGQSASLIVITRTFTNYGLTNFTLINSRDDPFKWNSRAEPFSVNLYLEPKDFFKISFLQQVFLNISLAGIRLYVLCPIEGQDCYGLNYGNAVDAEDYVTPPPFTPT